MQLVRKVRKDRVARGQAIASTREELEQIHWVRCCACGKYREMPKGVTLDEMLEVYGLQHVSELRSPTFDDSSTCAWKLGLVGCLVCVV